MITLWVVRGAPACALAWLAWLAGRRLRGAPTWSADLTAKAGLDPRSHAELAEEDTALIILALVGGLLLYLALLVWSPVPSIRIGGCTTVTVHAAHAPAAVALRRALHERYPNTAILMSLDPDSWKAIRALDDIAGRCAIGVGPVNADRMWRSQTTGMRPLSPYWLAGAGNDDWLFDQAAADPALETAVTGVLHDAARRRIRSRQETTMTDSTDPGGLSQAHLTALATRTNRAGPLAAYYQAALATAPPRRPGMAPRLTVDHRSDPTTARGPRPGSAARRRAT